MIPEVLHAVYGGESVYSQMGQKNKGGEVRGVGKTEHPIRRPVGLLF